MKRAMMLTGVAALRVLATACGAADTPAAAPDTTTSSTAPAAPGESGTAEQVTDQPAPREPESWTEHRYRWETNGYGSSVTIPAPQGWTVAADGDEIEYRDPTTRLLLRLNLEQDLPGDPLDVVAAQEEERSNDVTDYARVGIEASPLGEPPNGADGATWTHTLTQDGTEYTAIAAGFHPFGDDDGRWVTIYFSAPSEIWGDVVDSIFWNHAAKFSMAG